MAGKRGFAKKGVVLNNGIDSEKYRLSDAKRAAVRRALGVEDQSFWAISAKCIM